MRTLVELRINQKVDLKIIKEVKRLTKINTPKPKEINVEKDLIDDNLILIIFESYKGRQVDLVEGIIQSYSYNLEEYSDISVFFETKTKKISIKEKVALGTKNEVVRLINDFFESERKKNFELMSKCLDERIELQPKPTIRSSMNGIKKSTYLEYVEKLLSKYEVNHEIIEYITKREGYQISCQCELKIKGINNATGRSFIASGEYKFKMEGSFANKLKISSINRKIKKIEGDLDEYRKYLN